MFENGIIVLYWNMGV